jgi:hypothetical protein
MKRLDYLRLAVRLKLMYKKDWMLSAFSVFLVNENTARYHGQIVPQPWGYSYVDLERPQDDQLVKIEDSKPNESLFRFTEVIEVDSSLAANVREKVTSTIGDLVFNEVTILSSFGKKHPYTVGPISISKLEDAIAAKLQDTPATEEARSDLYYYCDEYVKFTDALQYLKMFSQLCTWSATKKTVVAPPGIKEFKKQLLIKYEGKLTDPVEVAKFDAELLAFDDAFLKGDPANGTFVKGKIRETARKKLFLAVGGEKGFGSGLKVTTVKNSLDEGWSKDPEEFVANMNSIRSGSFSRGAETVNGGVSAKILIRSAANYEVVKTDCGRNIGIKRLINKDNFEQLVGRNVIQGTKPVLVENKQQAENYLGKVVATRSPMYCKLPGEKLCSVCAGNKLSQYPKGLAIPLTEISAIILSSSLKAMHSNALATAKLDVTKAFT